MEQWALLEAALDFEAMRQAVAAADKAGLMEGRPNLLDMERMVQFLMVTFI